MKRIRISLTQEVFLNGYKAAGIKTVFVHPGYETERNIEVGFEPIECEVTEEVCAELITQEVNGVKRFNVEDVEVREAKTKTKEENAEQEYKDRQKQRGK